MSHQECVPIYSVINIWFPPSWAVEVMGVGEVGAGLPCLFTVLIMGSAELQSHGDKDSSNERIVCSGEFKSALGAAGTLAESEGLWSTALCSNISQICHVLPQSCCSTSAWIHMKEDLVLFFMKLQKHVLSQSRFSCSRAFAWRKERENKVCRGGFCQRCHHAGIQGTVRYTLTVFKEPITSEHESPEPTVTETNPWIRFTSNVNV